MRPKEFYFSAYCREKEKFKVRVYFENDVKIFTTDTKPLIVNNNKAIVIKSDNGNEYYYKLSMIDGYEIEKLPF